MDNFMKTFGRIKGAIIGMVHLRALPGAPRNTQKLDDIIRIACTEAELYKKANVDSICIENMHDRPWHLPHQLGPDTVANMAVVSKVIRQELGPKFPLGVQVLSACNREALAVAASAGLNFIRAEGFVFSHIGDEGPINSCAADLVRYRKELAAEHIHIFTDIKKKHSSHAVTSDVSLTETAQAAELFLSDGVVVTGVATGQQTDPHDVRDVMNAVKLPVLVGSGVNSDNVANYLSTSAIVIGSHLKVHGRWDNDLDPIRLHHFMSKVQRYRKEEDESLELADPVVGDDEDMDEEQKLKARIVSQGE